MATSIVIADDHDLIREGIKAILRRQPAYRVVGEAVNGEDAVEKVRRLKPDVLLLDISMPKRSGLDLLDQARRISPSTKIIIISVHRAPLYISKALRAGVKGYLHKEKAIEDLLPALQRVVAGNTYLSSAAADSFTQHLADAKAQPAREEPALTERETDVLRLVADGKTAKEIAELLSLSPRTVENYKQALLHKLDLRNTSELIRYALTHHLTEGEGP